MPDICGELNNHEKPAVYCPTCKNLLCASCTMYVSMYYVIAIFLVHVLLFMLLLSQYPLLCMHWRSVLHMSFSEASLTLYLVARLEYDPRGLFSCLATISHCIIVVFLVGGSFSTRPQYWPVIAMSHECQVVSIFEHGHGLKCLQLLQLHIICNCITSFIRHNLRLKKELSHGYKESFLACHKWHHYGYRDLGLSQACI